MIDRDAITEFVENHTVPLAAGLAAFLLFLLVVLVILGTTGNSGKKAAKLVAAQQEKAVSPEEMWLPAEPLQVPGVQLFRDPEAHWSSGEMKKWYTVPDTAALKGLRSAGRKLIDEILEPVP